MFVLVLEKYDGRYNRNLTLSEIGQIAEEQEDLEIMVHLVILKKLEF